MAKTKLTAALVLVALLLIVVLQNMQPVDTTLLFMTVTMPRAALLGIAILIGVGVGILVALWLADRRPKKN